MADRLDNILGPVRSCAKCHEEWPTTDEFWYRDGHDDRWLRGPCRACYLEDRKKYEREKYHSLRDGIVRSYCRSVKPKTTGNREYYMVGRISKEVEGQL